MSSSLSPFRWAEFPRPSIFADDPTFRANRKTGLTGSQRASQAVDEYQARTGKSAGSIRGISARGNLLIEESENGRRPLRSSAVRAE